MSVVTVEDLALRFGARTLFEGLGFELERGELLAVLGPNGTGKTSLIRILLGLLEPSAGTVTIEGCPPRERCHRIGYVPQQRIFDRDVVLRGRDLVRLGLDGHRWGFGRLDGAANARVDATLAEVGATAHADAPVGRLSGGEQQRLRVAQALVADPVLILADEPLLSLDLAHQRGVVDLLDARRRSAGTPVVFVTHDVNPVLHTVDRVLYLAPEQWAIGKPHEVLTSKTLSNLYGTPVDVLHVRGRVVVVGTPDDQHVHHVHEEH
ncbi:MAG TPA: metal ABC transporter ATP-binding protein [Gaiellaceae bacterium]|nr:metal ABC transporter ATP-binding protein [Gaiellaceae bacterium]